MAYIPYGYRIVDGNAVVDIDKAEHVRVLFNEYLNGVTLKESAQRAGINKTHSAVGLLLENRHYMGDDFYPPIIDTDTWNRVAAERKRQNTARGNRTHKKPPPTSKVYILKPFEKLDIIKITNGENTQELPTLLLQRAEAIYSKIEAKEMV